MADNDGSYEIEDFRWLVRTVFRDIHRKQAKKVWVLGAGASVDSKIDPAPLFAHRWSCELLNLDPARTSWEENIAHWPEDPWLKELCLQGEPKTPGFLGQQYFGVYARRFKQNANAGYADLRKSMEGCTPSVGYLVLAQLISDGANLVITVNFDNLIADALFLTGKRLPLIVDHEDVAHLANPREDVALICKIHRDLLKAPLNTDEEMRKLSEKWKPPLDEIFKNHAPVFIGYGGNDQTLMGYLMDRAEGFREAPIWLHYTKLDLNDEAGIRAEVSPPVSRFLSQTGGILVPHTGFDDLMYFAQRNLQLPEIVKELRSRTESIANGLEDRLNELAKKTAESKDNAVARATVQDAAKTAPRTVQDWILRAHSEPDLERQVALYQEAIKQVKDAELYVYLAYTLNELGRFEEALGATDEAIRLDQRIGATYSNRAFALNRLDRFEEALAAADEAIRLVPEEGAVYSNRSVALSGLDRFEEALAAADEAIRLAPEEGAGYANRAFALNRLDRFEEALAAADEAIQLAPEEAVCYTNRAFALSELGRFEEALAAADEAVRLAPGLTFGYRHRGHALAMLGRYEEAEDALRTALRIDPKNGNAYYSLAVSSALQGRHDQALSQMKEAVRLKADRLKDARTEPAFATLRDDPAFGRLLANVQ